MREKFVPHPLVRENPGMAVADAPTPLPGRATEADRERAARLLRAGTVDGRLSTHTFIDRIERPLGACSRSERDSLVVDFKRQGRCAARADEVEVRPGDSIALGGLRFRAAARAR